ncbi:DUF4411 family protein [Arhodomonas sp. KWT2]|uniref:DUF4411 family protein n=1 Tax=unclassified Arhodomonas TaxID=2621637 RepID=UPI0013CFBAB9|nr:DUF4411 family protein [Arhodomonas sp. KWT]
MSFSYLLDANTYIQAKNFHYRMHIVPGFWDWLDLHFHNGAVGSFRPVRDELEAGKDQLSDWVKERRDVFVPVDDEATQTAFADIANFVMTHDVFAEPHTTTFLDGADPWLIAKAIACGAEVITQETRVAANSKKVKVPNLCEVYRVPYRNTYDLMDLLEARLVLDR